MFKQLLLTLPFLLAGSLVLMAQADDKKLNELKKAEAKDIPDGWKKGGSFGLSLDQLLLIQPRVGAGEDRIGFGGIGTVFANHKKGRLTWDNGLTMQLGVQRIGNNTNPWLKNVDVLRFGTKLGYQSSSPKLFYAVIGNVETQITPTYEGNTLNSNNNSKVNSHFFAPAIIELLPGIDWRPDAHLSVLVSPIAAKWIVLADQDIANRLGDKFGMEPAGNNTYKTSRTFFGANLSARYTNKFLKDKLLLNSRLDLFTNYLKEPQNVDVRWINDIGVAIFKNISINLITDFFYDHDILVQKDYQNGKYQRTGRGASFTEQLVIKYNTTF